MREEIISRALELAHYVICNNCTIRSASKHFGVSKSTVHKDLTYRLPHVDAELYQRVSKVLRLNLAERHLRGGNATKNKYLSKKTDARQ